MENDADKQPGTDASADVKESPATPAESDELHGTIEVLDKTEGKVIKTFNVSGKFGTMVQSPVPDFVRSEAFENRLYLPADTETIPNAYKITSNRQVWRVNLKHRIKEKAVSTHLDGYLRVMYVYGKNSYKAGQQFSPDYFSFDSGKKVLVDKFQDADFVTGEYINKRFIVPDQPLDWINNDISNIIPQVTGYEADPTSISVTNIKVPEDFDPSFMSPKDFVEVTVTYNPKSEKATVIYVDDTTTPNKELHRDTVEGFYGNISSYLTKNRIDEYLKQNYELISDDTNGNPFTFNQDDKTFYVHLKRKSEPDPVIKTVTNTVKYVMSDGSNAPKDNKQTLTFHGIKNSAGKITWDNDKQKTFADVESPTITGYTPDKAVVKGATVTPDSKDITTTVTYTKNVIPQTDPDPVTQLITIRYVDPEDHVVKETKETVQPGDVITDKVPNGYTTTDGKTKITHTVAAGESLIIVHVVKPAVPDNGKHDEPTDPEKPVQPNIPKTPESSKPQAPAIADEPAAPATKRTAAPIQPAAPAAQLPQTSNKQNRAGLIGLAVAAAGLLLGLSGKRKKN